MRYADAKRFELAERVTSEPQAAGASCQAPQLMDSPFDGVIGQAAALPESEDCLEVTITVPVNTPVSGAPVMVWLHGGGWMGGSGGWNVYDARKFTAETGVVVVAANYRLGVLGYLRAEGVSAGNLGLLDQVLALEWVRDNVHHFGGDPERVTLAGESAGGHSVAILMGIPRTRGLFSQAIIQSAPLGQTFQTRARARRVADGVLGALGGVDPREASAGELLKAGAAAWRQITPPTWLTPRLPFLPIAGVDPLPDERSWKHEITNRAQDLSVLVGTTTNEMVTFYHTHPLLSQIRRLPVLGRRISAAIEDTMTKTTFSKPTLDFATTLVDNGAKVFAYQLNRLHVDSPYRACHGLDLPLLFGTPQAWSNSPMLQPLSFDGVDAIGRDIRRRWRRFIVNGDPGWPRYRPLQPPHSLPD
ncbi:carboxylesterase family protein [Mycobacteroides chelonae]|nr:carboxylesterase family protein [Mycobacteroides chelonae]